MTPSARIELGGARPWFAYGADPGPTLRLVACSNPYANSWISRGSAVHAVPVNPTPNGAGLALEPVRKRRRRRVGNHSEGHYHDWITGPCCQSCPARSRRQNRIQPESFERSTGCHLSRLSSRSLR